MKRTLGFIFGVVRLKIRGKDYTPINLINCRFGTAARHFQVLEGHRKHFLFLTSKAFPVYREGANQEVKVFRPGLGQLQTKKGPKKQTKVDATTQWGIGGFLHRILQLNGDTSRALASGRR